MALLSRRDGHHAWAASQVGPHPPPWKSCEPALSEAFHLLAEAGRPALSALLRRRAVVSAFDLGGQLEPTLRLMEKYRNVPMALADACLVRMTEVLADSFLLTTDTDFLVYRRHGRQAIHCLLP
ncbi:MAG: pilus assembly protein [Acidobacteriota bacterium]